MIVEAFLNFLFLLLEGLLTLLPDVSWDVNNNVFTAFFEILRFACYLLPMTTIILIFKIIVSLIMFRIGVSLIKTIWNLLPFA